MDVGLTMTEQSRVNSPVFRLALTFSVLWTVAISFAAYKKYDARTGIFAGMPDTTKINACQTVEVLTDVNTWSFETKNNPDWVSCRDKVMSELKVSSDEEDQRLVLYYFWLLSIPIAIILTLSLIYKDVAKALYLFMQRYWRWLVGETPKT